MRCVAAVIAVGLLLAVTGTAGATSIQDRDEYRPSTGLTLGNLYAGGAGSPWGGIGYQLNADFQLNLVYQAGIDDSDIEALNDWNYPTALNYADDERYFLRVDPDGYLPIGTWDFHNSEQHYALDTGEEWVKWTLSYWDDVTVEGETQYQFHTIFAGDILDTIPDDPYLRVLPTAGYRSFLWDGFANDVEVFEGASVKCEVLGYYYSDSLEPGKTLDVKLIPEPMTMAGLVLGVGSLVGYVRRRRA